MSMGVLHLDKAASGGDRRTLLSEHFTPAHLHQERSCKATTSCCWARAC